MRGFVVLLSYVVGLSAVIGIGMIVWHSINRRHPQRPSWPHRKKSVSRIRPSNRRSPKEMRNLVRSAKWRMQLASEKKKRQPSRQVLAHTDMRKNRAISIATHLSFSAVSPRA
jgi:hypothetical protein